MSVASGETAAESGFTAQATWEGRDDMGSDAFGPAKRKRWSLALGG
jgi:hypothetical protein